MIERANPSLKPRSIVPLFAAEAADKRPCDSRLIPRLSYSVRRRHAFGMTDSQRSTPCYHWSPAAKERFVAALALHGSVARAAAAAGKSRGQAYKLRRRKGEAGFAAAWDAAVLVAQQHIGDLVCDKALDPVEYIRVPNAKNGRSSWRRVDPMLGAGYGFSLVDALDRSAARIGADVARGRAAKAMLPLAWSYVWGKLDA
jgi:hypothetical protein